MYTLSFLQPYKEKLQTVKFGDLEGICRKHYHQLWHAHSICLTIVHSDIPKHCNASGWCSILLKEEFIAIHCQPVEAISVSAYPDN